MTTNSRQEFEKQLAIGKQYEILWNEYLKSRGFYVLPGYEFAGADGDKSPRLDGLNNSLVIPDLQLFQKGRGMWHEVKYKTKSVLHRKSQRMVTGLALRLYRHYKQVKDLSGMSVYLIFIHDKENEIRYCEIDEAPVNHIWPKDTMDKGGTIFLKYINLHKTITLSELKGYTKDNNDD